MSDSAILVVDDIDANLLALEVTLAPLGCTVVRARSGDEALARLLEREFALVLLDVQMPGMDGYETARWIRSTQRTRDVPVVFVTAHDHDDAKVRCAYQLGAVDFLWKPYDAEILRSKARVFLALHERTQADRRKTEFLATLAHELRNPLAPMRSCVEVLRASPDAAARGRAVDVLDRQVTRVTRLVDDLVDVARVVVDKVALRRDLVDLATVIDHALVETRRALDDRGHTLDVVAPAAPVVVHADLQRLVQVVVNLLTNAIRYTPADGAIELAWGRRLGTAFVRVSDNGIGIEPDAIGRMFEMFAQEGVARGQGGLGLGLTLAKRLIELHGGAIRATSAGRGRGSTFEITLPVARDVAPRAAVAGRVHAVDRCRRRVLLVEDNDDTRELLAELLRLSGHEVATAADGPSALALLTERTHDVALVDLGLPGFDGVELALRARAQRPDLPTRLVAVTGFAQPRDRERTALGGFDAHLVKPVASTDVLALIDSLCAPA